MLGSKSRACLGAAVALGFVVGAPIASRLANPAFAWGSSGGGGGGGSHPTSTPTPKCSTIPLSPNDDTTWQDIRRLNVALNSGGFNRRVMDAIVDDVAKLSLIGLTDYDIQSMLHGLDYDFEKRGNDKRLKRYLIDCK